MKGNLHYPGEAPERLWVCLRPECAWARFLSYPTDRDHCLDYGLAHRGPAEEGDENLDVRLPDGRVVHIDSYDPARHAGAALAARKP